MVEVKEKVEAPVTEAPANPAAEVETKAPAPKASPTAADAAVRASPAGIDRPGEAHVVLAC